MHTTPSRIFEPGHESRNFELGFDVPAQASRDAVLDDRLSQSLKFNRVIEGGAIQQPTNIVGLSALNNDHLARFDENSRNALAHGISAYAKTAAELQVPSGRNVEDVARGIARSMPRDDVARIRVSLDLSPNLDRVKLDASDMAHFDALHTAAQIIRS